MTASLSSPNVGGAPNGPDLKQPDAQINLRETVALDALRTIVFTHEPTARTSATELIAAFGKEVAATRADLTEDPALRATPVAIPSHDGWKEIEIRECKERLVPVGPGSSTLYRCATDARYFQEDPNQRNFVGEPIKDAVLTLFGRESLVNHLGAMAERLWEEGKVLRVFDIHRRVATQGELRSAFDEKLALATYRDCHDGKDPIADGARSAAQVLAEHSDGYVARPSSNMANPSPHSTGAVADLWIMQLDKTGVALIEFIERSASQFPDKFSAPSDLVPRLTRRLTADSGSDGPSLDPALVEATLTRDILPNLTRDLMIQWVIRTYGRDLNGGAAFDDFRDVAGADYFERNPPTSSAEVEARDNRRLFWELAQAGRVTEFWETRFDDQVAAAQKRNSGSDPHAGARFGLVDLNAENWAFEKSRRALHEELPLLKYRTEG